MRKPGKRFGITLAPCKYCGNRKFEAVRTVVRWWEEKETRKRPVPPGAKDIGLTEIWIHNKFEVIQKGSVKCKKCGLALMLDLCGYCKAPILPYPYRDYEYEPQYDYGVGGWVHRICKPPMFVPQSPEERAFYQEERAFNAWMWTIILLIPAAVVVLAIIAWIGQK